MKSTKSTNFNPKSCKCKARSVSSIENTLTIQVFKQRLISEDQVTVALPRVTRQIVTARIASDRRVSERALHYSCNCERGSSILSLSLFFSFEPLQRINQVRGDGVLKSFVRFHLGGSGSKPGPKNDKIKTRKKLLNFLRNQNSYFESHIAASFMCDCAGRAVGCRMAPLLY